MTKGELEKALKECQAELAACRAELKQRTAELVEHYFGKAKGGAASSQKRAEQGQQLREFWISSATGIMEDLYENDPDGFMAMNIDLLVDRVVIAVAAAGFPFKATRSKDSIKRHLTANLNPARRPPRR